MSLSLRFPCQWIAGESCSTLWICRSSSLIWIIRFYLSFCLCLFVFVFVFGFRFGSAAAVFSSALSGRIWPCRICPWKFDTFVAPQVEPRWRCCSGQGREVRVEGTVGQNMGTEAEQTLAEEWEECESKGFAPALRDASLKWELRHTRFLSLTSQLSQLVFHQVAHLHESIFKLSSKYL